MFFLLMNDKERGNIKENLIEAETVPNPKVGIVETRSWKGCSSPKVFLDDSKIVPDGPKIRFGGLRGSLGTITNLIGFKGAKRPDRDTKELRFMVLYQEKCECLKWTLKRLPGCREEPWNVRNDRGRIRRCAES